jgi:ABC-2 type transport system ATP-binding protein
LADSESLACDAIVATDLTKVYGEKTTAVDRVSFFVREGEIFGFLGLNGAGKTTTIKMLSTLIPPTAGSATIFGFDLRRDGLEIRKRLGVVQQQESYDRNLTVESSLRLYAALWGIHGNEASEAVSALLAKFQLSELRRRRIRWLSFGQRRRLQVAREFLHDPSLLILDEPTVGMDLLARHSFLDYCRDTTKGGDGSNNNSSNNDIEETRGEGRKTIFYTTHIISEAEYLCDRVALIHKGSIIALDSPSELKKRYADVKSVSVVLQNTSDAKRVARLVEKSELAGEVQRVNLGAEPNELRLVSPDPFKLASEVSSLIAGAGISSESISIAEPSLEQVVVRLVGDG